MSAFLPALPELGNEPLVATFDVIRQVEIIVALVVAALLLRSLLRLPDNVRPLPQIRGYKVRVLALITGLLLLALHAYDRIGEAVVLGLFPLGPIFLGLCAYALHLGMSQPAPASPTEERLANFEPPKWTLPSADDDDEPK